MPNQILKRAGCVLLAVAIIGAAVMIALPPAGDRYLAALSLIPFVAGIFLFVGGPRAALWVRTLAVFMLAAGITGLVLAPFYQPVDLTFTEIRLDPVDFSVAAAVVVFILGMLLWITVELGRPPVQDAIANTRIKRWDMRLPAQAGGGTVLLAGLLLWFMLHGQSTDLATSLAFQQLGPDYRYHLSWISSASTSHGTSVNGVVTAWNDKEIKQVLLHWETR
jgi:hypothetical protein